VDKLIASVQDEVNQLKLNGPSQINIDKWRAESLRGYETATKTNAFWLDYINGHLVDGENMHEYELYDEIVKSVAQKDIKTFASKYLSGNNYIRLVLLPEQKTQ
jgi:zinc protease